MNQDNQPLKMDQPARYCIRVQGCIGEPHSDWFNGMELVLDTGDSRPSLTVLTGRVADQAALLGLLQNVYLLGLPILLVRCKGLNNDSSS